LLLALSRITNPQRFYDLFESLREDLGAPPQIAPQAPLFYPHFAAGKQKRYQGDASDQ
jgi:hypothetical protein